MPLSMHPAQVLSDEPLASQACYMLGVLHYSWYWQRSSCGSPCSHSVLQWPDHQHPKDVFDGVYNAGTLIGLA